MGCTESNLVVPVCSPAVIENIHTSLSNQQYYHIDFAIFIIHSPPHISPLIYADIISKKLDIAIVLYDSKTNIDQLFIHRNYRNGFVMCHFPMQQDKIEEFYEKSYGLKKVPIFLKEELYVSSTFR
jgi:hypothetical protein